MRQDVERQRRYYTETAAEYDAAHLEVERDLEHGLALALLVGAIDHLGIDSVLDVGAGTGRTVSHLLARFPKLRVVGVEPVAALREQGHAKGIGPELLTDGDGERLAYPDGSFDLVCEFATLHHVPRPSLVVAEMLRVAKKAVFISDSNSIGQGSAPARLLKRTSRALGLWPLLVLAKTRGKGYHYSEGDGIFYPYSVFDNDEQVRRACRSVHILNTAPAGIDPRSTSPHVALLGIK